MRKSSKCAINDHIASETFLTRILEFQIRLASNTQISSETRKFLANFDLPDSAESLICGSIVYLNFVTNDSVDFTNSFVK